MRKRLLIAALFAGLFSVGNAAQRVCQQWVFQTGPGSNTPMTSTGSLPVGNPGVPYYATVIPPAWTAPLNWTVSSGSLPSGLTLGATNGVISGAPAAAGISTFTAQVTDSAIPPNVGQISETLTIATLGGSDPQMPQSFMATAYPSTAGYIVKTVCASGCNYTDFQAALNSVHSDNGDTSGENIQLKSGATFTTSTSFTLPAYTMSAGKWIIVTTGSGFTPPAEGVRISPAASTNAAKILSSTSAAAIQTANNANHYWFMGVEIGVTSPVTLNYGVFIVGNGDTSATTLPSNIVLDRCYVHGNATGNIRSGLTANGPYVAAINSYFENFHDTGADTQAIVVWNSPGPVKVFNNFLQAAGENMIVGGAHAYISGLVNSDIQITQNQFFKPLTWYPGSPTYAGINWSVKNLLEMKNARRVFVEGNIFQNVWQNAQSGYAVLFTPRNDDGLEPQGTVNNITFRYNVVQHAGSAFQIAGADGYYPGTTTPTTYLSIYNCLMRDINGAAWGGADGRLFMLVNGESSPVLAPPAHIVINHNTGISVGSSWYLSGDNATNPTTNWAYENSIQAENNYGFFGVGVGTGNPALAAYYTTPVFTNNVDVAGASGNYPVGNFFPAAWSNVGFADYGNCAGGAYSIIACGLQASSPYHNAATDGTDIGFPAAATAAATYGD